ncbi:hypothetical protein BDK51DRAFT_25549 [Blyttiomyces helicus]|uniref:HAMP domain-containing protein n=1 Tax=Blyttiomyces helicus TaxID=388810 RepID=A0A4P9W0V9_9FUNG|nr:hypothetical protein BDK51DRAFT_25549 [Blyttiomyces helicus]|eukprot:RKO85734.1 hypothetical protein BDK51DRAFT_25549 [Blyttiomyces helicus]
MPIPEFEEGPNREPIGDYQMWDPAGLAWIDIEGVLQGLRGCWNTRIYNFNIDLPEAPTASSVTGISFQGILQTSGLVDFLQTIYLTPNSIVSLWGLDGTMWGTNQGTAFTVLDEVFNTSTAANAVNCTNPLVKATAQYILQTYGSYNVQETTNFRIKCGDDWILANTRMINDGRGLQILLVVTLPESDYLHTVTQTKINAIAVSVSMAAAVLILAIVISHVVTLPLRRLVRIMQQAVHLDFSALQSDWIRNFSHLKELADAGEAFEDMLVMFADAVRANTFLMQSREILNEDSNEDSVITPSKPPLYAGRKGGETGILADRGLVASNEGRRRSGETRHGGNVGVLSRAVQGGGGMLLSLSLSQQDFPSPLFRADVRKSSAKGFAVACPSSSSSPHSVTANELQQSPPSQEEGTAVEKTNESQFALGETQSGERAVDQGGSGGRGQILCLGESGAKTAKRSGLFAGVRERPRKATGSEASSSSRSWSAGRVC